jgi:hypothetical protein
VLSLQTITPALMGTYYYLIRTTGAYDLTSSLLGPHGAPIPLR